MNKLKINFFKKNGYYLERSFFNKSRIYKALKWLRKQNPSKLVKSWTEKEPGVPLAVYSVIHEESNDIARLTRDKKMLEFASDLIGSKVYIWSSKVNIKEAWCGTAEYYHQDLVYWKDRGYPKDEMLSCMIFLEKHDLNNAALHIIPGTHLLGYIKHLPFININGLAKFMVPPSKLNSLMKTHKLKYIKANPGDVLFFHTSLIRIIRTI